MSLENLLASLGHLNFLVNGRISLKIYIKFCFENFYWDYTESTDHLGDSEYPKNNKSLINLKNNKSQSISVYLFLFSLSNFFQWCRVIFNVQFVYYFFKVIPKNSNFFLYYCIQFLNYQFHIFGQYKETELIFVYWPCILQSF